MPDMSAFTLYSELIKQAALEKGGNALARWLGQALSGLYRGTKADVGTLGRGLWQSVALPPKLNRLRATLQRLDEKRMGMAMHHDAAWRISQLPAVVRDRGFAARDAIGSEIKGKHVPWVPGTTRAMHAVDMGPSARGHLRALGDVRRRIADDIAALEASAVPEIAVGNAGARLAGRAALAAATVGGINYGTRSYGIPAANRVGGWLNDANDWAVDRRDAIARWGSGSGSGDAENTSDTSTSDTPPKPPSTSPGASGATARPAPGVAPAGPAPGVAPAGPAPGAPTKPPDASPKPPTSSGLPGWLLPAGLGLGALGVGGYLGSRQARGADDDDDEENAVKKSAFHVWAMLKRAAVGSARPPRMLDAEGFDVVPLTNAELRQSRANPPRSGTYRGPGARTADGVRPATAGDGLPPMSRWIIDPHIDERSPEQLYSPTVLHGAGSAVTDPGPGAAGTGMAGRPGPPWRLKLSPQALDAMGNARRIAGLPGRALASAVAPAFRSTPSMPRADSDWLGGYGGDDLPETPAPSIDDAVGAATGLSGVAAGIKGLAGRSDWAGGGGGDDWAPPRLLRGGAGVPSPVPVMPRPSGRPGTGTPGGLGAGALPDIPPPPALPDMPPPPALPWYRDPATLRNPWVLGGLGLGGLGLGYLGGRMFGKRKKKREDMDKESAWHLYARLCKAAEENAVVCDRHDAPGLPTSDKPVAPPVVHQNASPAAMPFHAYMAAKKKRRLHEEQADAAAAPGGTV